MGLPPLVRKGEGAGRPTITPETKAFRNRREQWVVKGLEAERQRARKEGRSFTDEDEERSLKVLVGMFRTTVDKVAAYKKMEMSRRGQKKEKASRRH